ncbi:MAG: type II 3-dehydroquinate dehydratase [Euryarchaeota archaeon]|mgnify:CR=1 FL=1|nr:type II 3-dehydroquinate dehydratase [Euryarchaeota archaeon]|tara:strand:- start:6089 stop:6514 length:426 start_codon:yes stop_codon:yes gene_type:complete
MRIGIINGPNLNMLGVREPGVYGNQTLDDIIESLKQEFQKDDILNFQSNDEGELISKVQEWGMSLDGIIINPGGYSHTSVAIRDAIASITTPVIEVHISNIHAREEFRHTTITGGACKAVISGLGAEGYSVALRFLIESNN